MTVDAKWWTQSENNIHEGIWDVLKKIENSQKYRAQKNLIHMQLYSNMEMSGLTPHLYSIPVAKVNGSNTPNVKLNIIHSQISTLASKITKNKPKPSFLTLGGDWGDRKKAKQLEKFVDGLFYQTDFYNVASKVFIDSLVFDLGALKIYDEGNKICAERVFPNELKVDDADGMYGKPRQLHQVKFVNVEVLKAKFPDKTAAIDGAIQEEFGTGRSIAPFIEVAESWHLASEENGSDGKHVISIDGATLLMEDYELNDFPFVFLRWTDKLLGFFGQGLAEQLAGIQLEINKVLKTIQLSTHLCSVPTWLVESSSKINKAHITNQIGSILEYSITPPQLITPNAVSPELFNHLQFLIEQAYQMSGVSQLSAQSRKPAGLNSGAALREYDDIESERFLLTGKMYEQFCMDTAKRMIDCAKRIYDEEGEFEVKIAGKNNVETIDWGSINLEEDSYMMQIFPISFLPSTPAGKLETIKEMFQAGLLTSKEEAAMLLDFPDTDKMFSMAKAPIELIDMMIEKMLDPTEPEYMSPDVIGNLELAKSRAQMAYQVARTQGAYQTNLDLLQRFITECMELLKATQQPPTPAPQQAPTGGMNGA
jgi:hypothetical protein